MKDILSTHLLSSMESAVSAIQSIAESNGYDRDFSDAASINRHFADTAMDHEDYADLAAESRTLADSMTLLDLFGTDDAKVKGRVFVAFDYNA